MCCCRNDNRQRDPSKPASTADLTDTIELANGCACKFFFFFFELPLLLSPTFYSHDPSVTLLGSFILFYFFSHSTHTVLQQTNSQAAALPTSSSTLSKTFSKLPSAAASPTIASSWKTQEWLNHKTSATSSTRPFHWETR